MVDYDKTREDATRRREQLVERRREIATEHERLNLETERITRELVALDQILEGIEIATSETPPDLESPGLTEHIRKVLQQTTVPLFPTQIRDSCLAVGISGTSMKNLLISVHSILERLKPNLETKEIEGKKAYKWKGLTPPSGTSQFNSMLEALSRPAAAAQGHAIPRRRLKLREAVSQFRTDALPTKADK